MEGEYDGRQSKDEVNINQKKGDIQHEKEKEWILPYKFRFKFRCSYIYNKV